MLLALLQGSARSGTTGEAEQEGGHNQITPVQRFAFATPGYFFSRIPQRPPWPAQASSVQDSLLSDPQTRSLKIPECWCCEAPRPSRHSAPCQGGASTLGQCKKDLEILLLPPGMDLPRDDLGRGRQCSVLLDHCSQVGSELCYCSSVNQHPPRAVRGLTLAGASSRILRHPPAAPCGAAAQPGLQQLLSRDLERFERVDSSPSPLQSSGIWYHSRDAQHQPCGRH